MTLFLITEAVLIYTEDVLRAQLGDQSDLKTPAAMGKRVERCLVLTNRLKSMGREPAIEFVKENEENADLRLLISTRNKWVHSGRSSNIDRITLDRALVRILSQLARVSIVLLREATAETPNAIALAGMSGLFGGTPVALHREPSQLPILESSGSTLIAVVSQGEIFDLFPFFVYERGRSGENRVKLLTRISGDKPEYLDPFESLNVG
jgi:hypothetical protein